eukprot:4648432-Pyramimonas_sp.AAC.1
MAGAVDAIDKCVKCVEDTLATCKLIKHASANCAVIYAKGSDGNITLDQYRHAKQLRPSQHRELTGADAEAEALKVVTDALVCLAGALACALITHVWLM